MAPTHCGLQLGGGVPAETENLITKRKVEKVDSGESLFQPQTLGSLKVGCRGLQHIYLCL